MRRKKTVVPAVPVEGVIDLEAEVPPTGTDIEAKQAVGPSAQAQSRPKRKYTRRASKKVESGIAVTPTFIDKDGIRSARIQAFIDYVDGIRSKESADRYDENLKSLLGAASQIALTQFEEGHAAATEKINTLAYNVEDGGYYRDDTKNRTRSDV